MDASDRNGGSGEGTPPLPEAAGGREEPERRRPPGAAASERPGLLLALDQAMGLVRQDRWLLGGLRDGRLRVLADSRPDRARPYRKVLELSHLARRSLHERRPLALASTGGAEAPAEAPPADWELDWPALVYAPVGLPGRRPVGLLIVGSLSDHWYTAAEVDYVGALGLALTAAVLSLDGPLSRLGAAERAAARLLGQGLSVSEVAAALALERARTQELVAAVLRKLALRSPRQLAELWPELAPLSMS